MSGAGLSRLLPAAAGLPCEAAGAAAARTSAAAGAAAVRRALSSSTSALSSTHVGAPTVRHAGRPLSVTLPLGSSALSAAATSSGRARRALMSTSAPASSGGGGSQPQHQQPTHPSGLMLYGGSGRGLGLDVPPSREPLYRESPLNLFFQRYYYLVKAAGVFSRRASTGVASEAIFRSLEEQATQSAWWESLGLPDSWITEHAMVALHVWMFHNRFKVDYNVAGAFNGRRMQEHLFERLWEDTTLRIRNAGIAEISVNKQLENVQKLTFDDMFGYDGAIRVLDDDNMELAAALWKGVFREAEGANTEAVLRLADYVRRETFSLLLQPAEDVYRGWITWGPAVGETPEGRLERQRRMLEGEWREALHPDGRVYFYHTATHERRWEPPAEGLYGRRRFALRGYFAALPEGHPAKALAGGPAGYGRGGAAGALPAGSAGAAPASASPPTAPAAAPAAAAAAADAAAAAAAAKQRELECRHGRAY